MWNTNAMSSAIWNRNYSKLHSNNIYIYLMENYNFGGRHLKIAHYMKRHTAINKQVFNLSILWAEYWLTFVVGYYGLKQWHADNDTLYTPCIFEIVLRFIYCVVCVLSSGQLKWLNSDRIISIWSNGMNQPVCSRVKLLDGLYLLIPHGKWSVT